MKKLILFLFIFYSAYVSAQVVAIPQVTGLPAALNSKVDKVTGKSLIADTSIVKLTGIQTGAQVNKIEGIQKNGVDLTITGKKVNITVPTTAAEIGAQPAGTYSTDIHGNISALNSVSNINTGDETTATIKTKLGITTLSGANTGDQTTVSGNAGTATKLQTSRTINGVAFDGTQNITVNAVDATSRVASSLLGAANGVATLDANGIILTTQLPSYIDDVLEYTNLAAFPATGETGKIYVAKDTNKTYRWSGSVYVYITSGAVDSVNGLTGVVSLSKSDLGLGNLDNTSDANKPISTAAQAALNGKQASGTYSTDIHGNITALNAVSGINGGDETLTSIKTKLGAASSSNSGYLTNTDFSNFSGKQNALGFTPYNATNPSGYISGINSGMVTTALGYTPWWSSNHPTTVSGYGITDIPSSISSNFIQNQYSVAQSANSWISGSSSSANVYGTTLGKFGVTYHSIELRSLDSEYGSAAYFAADAGADQRVYRISNKYSGSGTDFVIDYSDAKPYNTDFISHSYSERFRISKTGDATFSSSVGAPKFIGSYPGETFSVVQPSSTSPYSIRLNNAGGNFYMGVENSSGSFFSSPAYSSVLYSPTNNLRIVTNNTTFTGSINSTQITSTGVLISSASNPNVTLTGVGSTDPTIYFGRYSGVGLDNAAKIQYEYRTASSQESGNLSFWTNPNAAGTGSLTKRMTVGYDGIINIYSTQPSTSSSTGALVVAGGFGSIGNAHIGGQVFVDGINNSILNLTQTGTGSLDARNWRLVNNTPNWGDLAIQVSTNNSSTPSLDAINLNKNGNVGIGYTSDQGYKFAVDGTGLFSGKLRVTSTTDATIDPFPDGSIVTAGGIAAAKKIQAGGEIFSKGNIIADQDIFAGGSVEAASFSTYSGGTIEPVYQDQAILTGSTNGTMTCSMPFRTGAYKKVLVYCSALNGVNTYTFPVAFSHTPYIISNNQAGTASVTLTTTYIQLSGTNANGFITVEGY